MKFYWMNGGLLILVGLFVGLKIQQGRIDALQHSLVLERKVNAHLEAQYDEIYEVDEQILCKGDWMDCGTAPGDPCIVKYWPTDGTPGDPLPCYKWDKRWRFDE